ncbi:MAG TPA: hypothetical protein VLH39_02845, partial [Magnetospirillaceae bacterium]|nr:hypothetical protein [Magnetospirillaceae bacterium]
MSPASRAEPSVADAPAGGSAPLYLEVSFPIPVDRAFTYRSMPGARAAVGCRVEAPLGRRKAVGWVVGVSQKPIGLEAESVKEIFRVVDVEPLFGPRTAELASWLSGMYICSRGEALAAMLPSGRRAPSEPSPPFEDFPPEGSPLALSGEQEWAL